MLARVRGLAAPPVFEDEYLNRTAQLLNTFLLLATGLSLLGILSFPLFITEMLLLFMGIYVGVVLIYLICLALLHRRKIRAASITFIIAYWMVQNLTVLINGGVNSPSILNYATVILIAGFLLGWRASIVIAVLTILVGACFVYADAAAILSPPINPVSQSIGWMTLSFNLIALAFIQHWATRNLKLAVDRAQNTEVTLSERNTQLERAVAEHERTEIALRASEERYRVISELTSDFAYAYHRNLDGTRKIDWLIGSPAALTGYALDQLNELPHIYHPEDAERARMDMERTFEGEITEGEYRILTKEGKVRWIHTRRQPIWVPEENRFARFYATVRDVTDRRNAGEALRQTQEQRRQFLDQLKILHEVGLELARAETFVGLCRLAVELGRRQLGFDRLGLWFIDSSDPNYIVGSYGIDEHGSLRDERHMRLPWRLNPDMEMILDGRVFITRKDDAIIRDEQSRPVGQGWIAAARLRVGDQNLGWLFIDNLLRHEPRSDEQLELLALYAATISHLVTAKNTFEELRQTLEVHRQFLERLKTLHEVGLELARADTFDDLCRRAVDLGRSRLGFDRLGLWILDTNDPEYSFGSFGTDEHGLVKDERHIRVRISPSEDMEEILDGRVFITIADDAPLRGGNSQIVGYGWNAAAKVRFGDKHMGWLFIDNLLKREPRSTYQLELLALYAATIGHLATAKTTLEELRYSESRLQQAIHIARLGIWEWEIKPDITVWSDAMYEMYGVSPEDFTGKGEDYLNMTHPEDRAKQRENIERAFERARVEGGESLFPPAPQEFRLIRTDGTIRSVVGDAVAIVDENGEPVRMIGILMDVTDRKNAEKQALELALVREREENLREFISTISHDLKTPLSVINTSLYLLERITDPEHHKDKIQTIKAQAQLLEKYIQDILTISRLDHIPHMAHQPVSLNQSLSQIIRRLHPSIEQKNITTTLDLDDNLAAVFGDENEINRALVNLIENAMNYTPPNGSITIQTLLEGDSVVAAITDTGIGISEDDLPHIFERFYRASAAQEFAERGTGLGLAIVKRIVELHHGTIDVQSKPGQGTSFRIRFPLIRNSAN